MPRHPVQFRIHDAIPLAALQASALRRLRWLESVHPAVCDWSVELEPVAASHAEILRFEARVAAGIVGGDALHARADGGDALAALRLAFNGLEQQLATETERALDRASQWLQKVKTRLGQRRFETD